MKTMKKKNSMKKHASVIAASAMAAVLAVPVFAAVSGDVNGSNSLEIADAVMLTKYLTTQGELTDPAAGDYNTDGVINAVDLTLLKRALLTGSQSDQPQTPVQPEDLFLIM